MLHINVDNEFEQEIIQAILPQVKQYINTGYEECFREVIGSVLSKDKAFNLFSFIVYDFMSKYMKNLADTAKNNQNIKTSFDVLNQQIIH